MKKAIARIFILAMTLLFFQAVVFAQEASSGRITGTVTDPSGAVVAGATIEILNVGTGVRNLDAN